MDFSMGVVDLNKAMHLPIFKLKTESAHKTICVNLSGCQRTQNVVNNNLAALLFHFKVLHPEF